MLSAGPATDDRVEVAFYGDDFTGSTDSLYQLHRCGLPGVLFIGNPGPARLADHDGSAVVGIAGTGRALAPKPLEEEVGASLRLLATLAPTYTQYKICSTFDSSPRRGSIGRVLELSRELFDSRAAAIVAAQPQFGRFTVFGNHFARDSGGRVHRLDRHPTMSAHPVTPMDEADLCRHLAAQTDLPIGGFPLNSLRSPEGTRWQDLATVCDQGVAGVVFDALVDADLEQIARSALGPALSDFGIGSGGLSYGLGRVLGAGAETARSLEPVERGLVLVGSLADQTRRQVRHAIAQGWRYLPLTPTELAAASTVENPDVLNRVLHSLERGESVIVGTSPLEPAPGAKVPDTVPTETGQRIGVTYARILSSAIRRGLVGRSAIAGGDTSGWTIKSMDAYALAIVGALDVAAAVCALHSDDASLDGAQVVLKGGQVGGDDFFLRLVSGEPADRMS